MVKNNSQSKLYNAVIVILGAMLMGMLWRVRGTHGWGSSWGLLNAGIIFVLFLTVALGERKKMNISWTALTALSFMLTTPAWGTLLNQITGVLNCNDRLVSISPWSGVFMMLCLGFGLASLFGIMLGRSYSDKQWKFHHILILLGVFYAVNYITKATVSHLVIQLVQPEAISAFADDLKAVGLGDDVYKTYMQHFDNDAWAKKFTMDVLGRQSSAGRNYFQEIMTISSAFSAVAALITTRFVIKDKVAALTGTVTCGAFAVAITLADLFFWYEGKGYAVPDTYAAWSLWEFFTGFIAGGIITAFVVLLKKKENIPEITFDKLPEKVKTVFTFLLGYIGMMGVTIVRPVLERFDKTDLQLVFTAISVVVALSIVAVTAKKCGCALQKTTYEKFCTVALPCFVIFTYIAYMFIGNAEYQNFRSIGMIHNICVTVSVVCVMIWSFMQIKKMNSK
ncbi:MAG: hypothetical protein IKJ69_03430 [Clostridia bacterium]|nr:hypothetical protein [Clostridia bacterium]